MQRVSSNKNMRECIKEYTSEGGSRPNTGSQWFGWESGHTGAFHGTQHSLSLAQQALLHMPCSTYNVMGRLPPHLKFPHRGVPLSIKTATGSSWTLGTSLPGPVVPTSFSWHAQGLASRAQPSFFANLLFHMVILSVRLWDKDLWASSCPPPRLSLISI